MQKSFVPTYVRLLQAKEQDKQEPARKEMIEALRTFTAEIKGPYFLGEEFSLVDVAIAPWIQRDDVMIEHRGYTREAVSAEWKRYADHVVQRESVVKTKSVGSRHQSLVPCAHIPVPRTRRSTTHSMRGFFDDPQSEAAKAIRFGRALL